jgi:prepilin-type N-terminal cleavage/methylation domain-containing protein
MSADIKLKRIASLARQNFVKQNLGGFTLNELLIVIAILAVMAGAVVLIVNPGELMAQARDSTRIGEINSLSSAIALYSNSIVGGYKGEDNTVYISIPDTSSTCANLTNLPSLPAGWSYHCAVEEDFQNSDGTGWLPVNFNAMPGGSPFEQIPVDPKNDENFTLYYSYVYSSISGGYALSVLLESEKQGPEAYKDGGTDLGRFEKGTDLAVWAEASGLVGYWPFSGSGSISSDQTTGLEDLSGYENNGIASNNNGTGMSFVEGKAGSAINLDGADDYVKCGTSSSLTPENISLVAWAKADNFVNWHGIISNMNSWGTGFSLQMGPTVKIAAMVSGSYLTTSWTPQIGDWYHIVATHQNSNNSNILYVNGQEENRSTRPISYEENAKTCIGIFYTSPSLFFSGIIDEVMVYNRVLKPSEIRAIYNATK